MDAVLARGEATGTGNEDTLHMAATYISWLRWTGAGSGEEEPWCCEEAVSRHLSGLIHNTSWPSPPSRARKEFVLGDRDKPLRDTVQSIVLRRHSSATSFPLLLFERIRHHECASLAWEVVDGRTAAVHKVSTGGKCEYSSNSSPLTEAIVTHLQKNGEFIRKWAFQVYMVLETVYKLQYLTRGEPQKWQ